MPILIFSLVPLFVEAGGASKVAVADTFRAARVAWEGTALTEDKRTGTALTAAFIVGSGAPKGTLALPEGPKTGDQ